MTTNIRDHHRSSRLLVLLASWSFSLGVVVGIAPPAGAQQDDVAQDGLAGEKSLRQCEEVLPPDLREVCERGILRVARFGGDRPPFFFLQDGEWVGFDVDLGRDLAARLGVRYEEDASATSFDQVVDKVAAGTADLGLSKLSATLPRAKRVRFSSPYLTVYQAIVMNRLAVRRSTDPFQDLNDNQYTVGALAGSSYVGYAATALASAQVRPYDNFEQMMSDVVAGDLHAVLMDSARANTWRAANPEKLIQVRTVVDKGRRDPLAIAVAWEKANLLAWVDLYLATIRADGSAERMYREWFEAQGVVSEE